LPQPEHDAAFGAFFDRFGDARVVLLGEATHGTSEFYRARAAITKRLITSHGFNIVAVEADWPDASRIDRYVRHLAPAISARQGFERFPTWMWRNQEVLAFLDWLRHRNESLPAERRTAFRGLDVYSLGASIEAVLAYLDKVDPNAASGARRGDAASAERAAPGGSRKRPAGSTFSLRSAHDSTSRSSVRSSRRC